MKKLLKYEFHRLLTSVSALVCLIIAFLYSLSDAFISNFAIMFFDGGSGLSSFDLLISSMDLLPMLLGIFATLYACGDYSNNSLKNVYSKGFSRTYCYLAKITALAAYTGCACVASWVASFLGGAAFYKVGTPNGALFAALFASVLAIFAFACFCFMFATLIKRTGSSIIFTIFGPVGISVVLSILNLIIFRGESGKFSITELWITMYLDMLAGYHIGLAPTRTLIFGYGLSAFYAMTTTAFGVLIVNKQDV